MVERAAWFLSCGASAARRPSRGGGVDMAAVEPLRDRPAGRRAATTLMSLDINEVSVIGNSSRPSRNKEANKTCSGLAYRPIHIHETSVQVVRSMVSTKGPGWPALLCLGVPRHSVTFPCVGQFESLAVISQISYCSFISLFLDFQLHRSLPLGNFPYLIGSCAISLQYFLFPSSNRKIRTGLRLS